MKMRHLMDTLDAVEVFVLEPSSEHAAAARAQVAASVGYDPEIVIADVVAAFAGYGGTPSPQEVVDAVNAAMPGLVLSPEAHARLAHAYHALGREGDSAREKKLAALSVAAIRDDADGTEESSYRPLRVSDEYDLLRAMGRQGVSHALRRTGVGAFDVLHLDDGTEAWFRVPWMDEIGS